MTMLGIVQGALAEVGEFGVPGTVAGNSEPSVVKALALLNKEGKTLARRYKWEALNREHTFTTVAAQAEYDLPDDYRFMVSNTIWNRTESDQVFGPLTPQKWQVFKSDLPNVGISDYFRVKGGKFVLHPTPTSAQNLVFEYHSKNWCQSSGGTRQAAFAADSDTALLDEDILQQGLVWRWKKSFGLPYEEDLQEYEDMVRQAMSGEAGAPTLHMDGNVPMRMYDNIPETGYGI